MARSPGFGSAAFLTFALLRLAFAPAPHSLLNLARHGNSPVHSTKGTPSPLNGLRLLVGIRFQVFISLPSRVLFTFPSRYSSAIGHVLYLGLPDGPGCSSPGSVPRRTRGSRCFPSALSPTALTLGRSCRSDPFPFLLRLDYPARGLVWPLRFRSPLLPESLSLLFSSFGTQMFHFPGVLLPFGMHPHCGMAGFPIGHRRILALRQLPGAFRRSMPSFFSGTCLGIRRMPFYLDLSRLLPTPAFAPISFPSLRFRTFLFLSDCLLVQSCISSTERSCLSFLYLFLLSSGFKDRLP